MFNIDSVRAQFPIFQQKIRGKNLCYLDSGASAQKPQILLDNIQNLYSTYYANIHRGAYYFSEETTVQYEQARHIIAKFLNAQDNEIVFTYNTTSAINLVCHSYADYLLQKGDKIVTTMMEHHANLVPWQMLRDNKGIVLEYVSLLPDGSLDMDDLRQKLKGCKLLALTHISNVLGTHNPIKDIIKMAHDEGAVVLIDGSQAVMHEKVDMQDNDADFYVFTGHKLYGPNGIGVLYGKYDILSRMRPYMGGGDMIEHVGLEKTTYAPPPARFEAGTPPIMEAICLGKVIEWFNQFDINAIKAHEQKLYNQLHDFVAQNKNIRILGTTANKAPIMSFTVQGCHVHDIATLLDQSGVCARAGLHCAEPLSHFFGVSGSIRFSIGMYNTQDDIQQACQALDKSLALLQQYGG